MWSSYLYTYFYLLWADYGSVESLNCDQGELGDMWWAAQRNAGEWTEALHVAPAERGLWLHRQGHIRISLVTLVYALTSRILKFFSITWIEKKLRCGSIKFWYGSECGSGSADPYLCLMDPGPDSDPDPAIFVSDLQDINKKFFLLITFWRFIYIMFQRLKVIKKSLNYWNQCFSYFFCLMIEGSGSISLSNGSGWGSGRPKKIGILRIRIRIRILIRMRIRNTASLYYLSRNLKFLL